jgi:hypothetical protein
MDDTTCIAKLEDIPFIFQYLNVNGPPLGLRLSKDKCAILLGTEKHNPLPSLPLSLLTELMCTLTSYCKRQLNFEDLTILGVPIGGPSYVDQALLNFTIDYNNLSNIIKITLNSPASKL